MLFDAIGDFGRFLMFPEPEDRPSVVSEPAAGVLVSAPVGSDLLAPVVSVGLRHDEVFGAPVPEAPIDEYDDALLRECDIDAAASV